MNKYITAVSKSLRALSIDAITKAKSGHPGLPLGCADIGASLFLDFLNIYPKEPDWINRDRFIMSAGHGSMLLYSLLHLSGFNLSLDDLKKFRVIESKTPGHPEFKHTEGVEATTGPLGAGISNGVGMAISQEYFASIFNRGNYKIINNYTYILAGDGCLMEGISYEAAALAGHLGLGRIILIYDSNNITIEGCTELSTSEDILKRFESMGWHTLEGDGHDIGEINSLIKLGKKEKSRPTIIKFNTKIGYGVPGLEGTSKVHGTPLTKEEVEKTRENLGIPLDIDFYIDPMAIVAFKDRRVKWEDNYNSWLEDFQKWSLKYPALRKEYDNIFSYSYDFNSIDFGEIPDKLSTRKSSGKILNILSNYLPSIIGGSGDLSPSTNTYLNDKGDFSKDNKSGRNLHFGIREHAMGGIANGISLYGGLRPFTSTFLVFSDYMKPAIRLAALMGMPTIFIFTHDSFYLGKDGPTHQPIEQLESLRGIPNLQVIRPGDYEETIVAWEMALKRIDGPTAIILSRQDLNSFKKPQGWEMDYKNGGYFINYSPENYINLITTGSEINMALSLKRPEELNIFSVSDIKLFYKKSKYSDNIIKNREYNLTLEAGINHGWRGLTSSEYDSMGVDSFGYSGESEDVARELNFTLKELISRIEKKKS